MSRGVIVIGAGGHGRVVADALTAAGAQVLGFADANPAKAGQFVGGLPVLGDESALSGFGQEEVCLANGIGSIGDLAARRTAYERLLRSGYHFTAVRHPAGLVALRAVLGDGVQILAGAIVQTEAVIGANSIVNTGAIVEHDCVIGRHCHIGPGSVLSGGVNVGDETHIGVGATIVQGVTIGAGALVAAGAVVVRDVARGARVRGTPATEWHT